MFWYIDRDSDAILITSEKWRKSLIRTRHRRKEILKKKKTIKQEMRIQAFSAFLDLFPDQDILGYIFG